MSETPEQPISNEPAMPDLSDLTDKQRAFVLAYCGEAGFNASEAIRLAGYKTSNPNDLGYQLRKTPQIDAAIQAILKATLPTPDESLQMLRQDATRTNREILEFAKRASDMAGVPAGASSVSSLISARTSARATLAKAHGLLTDNLKISGTDQFIAAMREFGRGASSD